MTPGKTERTSKTRLLLFLTVVLALSFTSIATARYFGADTGITSPLVNCNASSGCTAFRDNGPVLYVKTVSSRSIVIGLAADAVKAPIANDDIQISRQGDNTSLALELAGRSRVTVGFNLADKPLDELRIHLLLSTPMATGETYVIQIPGRELQFGYQPDFISPSIQVNQVGHLPDARKRAFAGNWLGTAGPLPVDDTRFSIHRADNRQVVFEGKLEQVSKNDIWSGNTVYRADFSGLQTPGQYFMAVPGLGRSHSFSIGSDVFTPVFRKTFRLFYQSRNIGLDGGIDPKLNAYVFPAGSYKMIRRGWFDAGDFGQYVVNAAPVWHAFAVGLDLAPAVFSTDDLKLPESHNGIPDMIDELEWGMDWLLGMQNTNNGGVYSRVAPVLWDEGLPQDSTQRRYLFEITSHASASFAAITALHARLLANWNPERAASVLVASRAAWQFVESTPQWPAEGEVYKNPKNVHAGEYPDKSATDNRLWAAAELFRTTGEPMFKTAFNRLLQGFKPDPTAGVTFRHQGLAAYWSMYRALQEQENRSEADDQLQEELAQVLTAAADWYLRKADEHPFNAPVHQHRPYTGWGSFAHSSRVVLPLLQARVISGDERYSNRAMEMSNPQLGANPQSISYITGVGERSPRHPLSMLSRHDQQLQPLSGIPVNGPHHQLPALWPSTRAVNDSYLPADYPTLRRYVDGFPLPPMSEPTIAEYAYTAVAYGLLSGVSRPTLQVAVDHE